MEFEDDMEHESEEEKLLQSEEFDPFNIEYWWNQFQISEEEFGIFDHQPMEVNPKELRERLSPEEIADLLRLSEYQRAALDEYRRFKEIEGSIERIISKLDWEDNNETP